MKGEIYLTLSDILCEFSCAVDIDTHNYNNMLCQLKSYFMHQTKELDQWYNIVSNVIYYTTVRDLFWLIAKKTTTEIG